MNKVRTTFGVLAILLVTLLATAGLGNTASASGNAVSAMASGTITPRGCSSPNCR